MSRLKDCEGEDTLQDWLTMESMAVAEYPLFLTPYLCIDYNLNDRTN